MTESTESFLNLVREFAGDSLRDVWVFDEETERCVYMRDDVADVLSGHDPEPYIDNERYGFITRRTYEDLTYASYEYTVRGFDEFVTFRTFFEQFGVLASVDRGPNHDFRELFVALRDADCESFAQTELSGRTGDSELAADD